MVVKKEVNEEPNKAPPKPKIKASDLPTLDNIKQEMSRRFYADYVKYVHEGRWLPSKHLVYICNTIQEFLEDKLGKQILILQVPPQHGKSMTVTETLPSWYLGKFPTRRVIEVSYGDDLAQGFGRRNKEKIERFGKKLFNIEVSKKVSAATEFELTNNVGGMTSRGIMAGITGKPADLILIDDPVKNRLEADLQSYRDRVWDEWLNSIKTRLSAKGKIIIIMTRWHEDDLAGRVIKDDKDKNDVHIINLPCEAEENDPLGREIGDALFPEIGKDKAWMDKFKLSYQTAEGTRAWSALFQGRPSSQEGNMLKRHWWGYWKPKGVILPPVTVKMPNGELENIEAIDLPDNMETILQSWDMTFKDTAGTDFVAGGVWGNKGSGIFYLDQLYERLDFVATIKSVKSMTEKWPEATMKLIEDKANGPAVISMLRHTINGLIAVQPKGSKQARASAVSPLIEARNVYLPHPMVHPWVNLFIEQCAAFPNGKNDDLVDQCSQALGRFLHVIVPDEDDKNDTREYPEEHFDNDPNEYESFFD